ncbi:glycoside hydrolase family 26 protein [uncultured Alistipes sp.]|uniref:glycoside hydrolase family 26 protein n=1 Tax=uncultured Alistipes sp. TaxID=538949 RepID=UPI00272C955B|nr:glycosyl hydrolase [uncultured Alistipes sp.]
MKRILICTLLLTLCTGTAPAAGKRMKAPQKTTLKMVDPDATPETKALYANLWCMGYEGAMFGHHDYPSYGIGWRGDADRSDVKDLVGSHPAVYSLDMAGIDDRKIQLVREARERGGVCMLVWHQSNPLTEGPGTKYPVGTAWDNTKVVDRILTEGSEMNIKYKARLDKVAEAFRKMVDKQGRPIPVIFRPLHEHTQTWNWWGRSATTHEEFVAFWRFIVSYLRDTKEIHNVIYAISPQMDALYDDPVGRILFRWPGDEWVDFVGMDCYHGLNTRAFVANVEAMSEVHRRVRKPVGVTETGLENDHKADYWTEDVLPALRNQPCAMVVAWRNDNPRHAYGPYPSDSTADNFRRFFDDPWTRFECDLPDMYTMPRNVTVK